MFELSSGDGPFHLDAIEEKMFFGFIPIHS